MEHAPPDGRIGLIAGNGQLPLLFARAARARGLEVVAVAHKGETNPALASEVGSLTWVRVGQVNRIQKAFVAAGVKQAAMAGGIGRVKALSEARPDLGAVRIISRLRSFRDDALLRAVAADFESRGITIIAPTDFLGEVLCPEGHLAGPELSSTQQQDVALGREVAALLGQADVGQTVVVHQGHVLALEAVEGTDEAIRRGGKLGGAGAVVVKRCKPQQDLRFDLPAAGPRTLEVMKEVGARVLALEAGRTVLLDAPELFANARAAGITLVGVR
ncbi:UDP-2,3-diacylglucosamine diphosphatase LpxI [Myxococcus sp. XM-1-1-1]|uniref:LpxI family protein n=1 Tax=Myxococcus sp. XM-1-1-1 TaxID=2874602 RepID=UPI001CBBBE7E|nr:UDP-2,3-diacylglucosamine diphosphatase LpxI [Myxococcus sp. XM-1-1-1]MBZ4407367.1 UDP-2,3-diacylglucosamine diphosphatase LpxI [Myxococcus sp. XM-1-1-1]BDT35861.1 UDP-2,3-diacylglucosamine diphosphatase LpxI [Myxococcus sp. MH1]